MSESMRAPEPVSVFFSGGGTGGHLYPALALAEALQEMRPDVVPFFVGAERGLEARVLPGRALPHMLLQVEGFQRGGGAGALLAHLRTLAKLLGSFLALALTFVDRRPALVVVTGGYAGAPAGILALLLGVPVVIQEQNATPGLTTRLLSLGARQLHLAFPEAASKIPRTAQSRILVGGNPVRSPVPVDRESAMAQWGLDPTRPVVLVVGGSQGSKALNEGVLSLLASTSTEQGLPGGFQLLWATGPSHEAMVCEGIRSRFGGTPPWLQVRGYIEDMANALGVADLALSRAGAMATSEFQAWGVPSILVPLPTAAADHQTDNARALEQAGAAILLPEAELSAGRLADLLESLGREPAARRAMALAARARGEPDAASKMVRAMMRLLPPPFPRPLSTHVEGSA